jgi:hypothetical protein
MRENFDLFFQTLCTHSGIGAILIVAKFANYITRISIGAADRIVRRGDIARTFMSGHINLS